MSLQLLEKHSPHLRAATTPKQAQESGEGSSSRESRFPGLHPEPALWLTHGLEDSHLWPPSPQKGPATNLGCVQGTEHPQKQISYYTGRWRGAEPDTRALPGHVPPSKGTNPSQRSSLPRPQDKDSSRTVPSTAPATSCRVGAEPLSPSAAPTCPSWRGWVVTTSLAGPRTLAKTLRAGPPCLRQDPAAQLLK